MYEGSPAQQGEAKDLERYTGTRFTGGGEHGSTHFRGNISINASPLSEAGTFLLESLGHVDTLAQLIDTGHASSELLENQDNLRTVLYTLLKDGRTALSTAESFQAGSFQEIKIASDKHKTAYALARSLYDLEFEGGGGPGYDGLLQSMANYLVSLPTSKILHSDQAELANGKSPLLDDVVTKLNDYVALGEKKLAA